jgi:hypothetical protein
MNDYDLIIYLSYVIFFIMILGIAIKSSIDFYHTKTTLNHIKNENNDQKR